MFYQDSMHPWVKSDHPGKCTICNMDLTPIYEGEKGFDMNEDMVVLSSNSITVVNVQTEEVKRRSLFRTSRVAGTLEANETHKTIITTPVACQIQTLAVEYAGVEVEKGQTLAILFSPELVQRRAYLNVLGLSFASASNYLSGSGTSDPYQSDLVAPQSGTVLERNVYEGQYVEEGEKLFTIADPSVLWFRFDVYEQQVPWFEPRQTVEVTVRAVPGKKFPAVISFIEPTLNDATRTVKVRADVANPVVSTNGHPRRLLQFGMYAEGRVRSELANVLAVPRAAILFPGGAAYAYVDKGDGAYERRHVQLGRQGDADWEVLQGLEEGDRVVTSGNVLIDAQAQFNQGSQPNETEIVTVERVDDQDDPEGDMLPSIAADGHAMKAWNDGWNPGRQQVLTEFLAVADGINRALADDDMEQLKQHASLLSNAITSLTREFGREHSWRTALEHVTPAASLPVSAAPFATSVANASATNLPQQENAPSALDVARARLNARYARIAQRDKGWQMRLAAIAETRVKESAASNALATNRFSVILTTIPKRENPSQTSSEPRAVMSEQGTNAMSTNLTQQVSEPAVGRMPSNRVRTHHEVDVERRALRDEMLKIRMAAVAEASRTNTAEVTSLTVNQRQALTAFLTEANGISQALAADDLEQFNRHITQLPDVLSPLQNELGTAHRWSEPIQRLVAMSAWPPAQDLSEARQQFLPFSTTVVELARQLRKEDSAFAGLKIYHCPMAPKPGLWLQAEGPLRNPFYGSQMLKCGKEVLE